MAGLQRGGQLRPQGRAAEQRAEVGGARLRGRAPAEEARDPRRDVGLGRPGAA